MKRKQFENHHAACAEEQPSIKRNPSIFHQALKSCGPGTGLLPILRGGHFHQVPVPLPDRCCCFLAMKWVVTECRENKHPWPLMSEKRSCELLQAFHSWGLVIKRKQDTQGMHKMAEANGALAHYC